MIAYDLRCEEGHQFEAWFRNLKAFELQRKRNLIECPRCGSVAIALVYRAATIRKQSLKKDPAAPAAALSEKILKILEDQFEDVGPSFPEEARRVHYGEAEPRNIRGEASREEEESLRAEGVPVVRIALPKTSH